MCEKIKKNAHQAHDRLFQSVSTMLGDGDGLRGRRQWAKTKEMPNAKTKAGARVENAYINTW